MQVEQQQQHDVTVMNPMPVPLADTSESMQPLVPQQQQQSNEIEETVARSRPERTRSKPQWHKDYIMG